MEKVIDQYWYRTGQPWFKGAHVGTGILAGSEDPHQAIWVADLFDLADRLKEHEPMLETEADDHVRELVDHIIETHNDLLDAKQDEYREQTGRS